jgi:hypothetical protein
MFLIRLEKWLCMDKDEQNSFWRCTLNIKYGEEMSGLHIGILCNAYAYKTNIECWHKEREREFYLQQNVLIRDVRINKMYNGFVIWVF